MTTNPLEPSEGSFCNPDAVELSVYPELASMSAYGILCEQGKTQETWEMLEIMNRADALVLSRPFKAIEHAAEGQPESLDIPMDIPPGSRLTWLGLHLDRYEGREDLDALREAVRLCGDIHTKIAPYRLARTAN